MAAQMGYDFNYIMHASGKEHMEGHLDGQDVDADYIQTVSDRMLADALDHECRVDPKDYWGMLDADHLRTYLSARITGMEAFAQTWQDPNNKVYKAITTPIGSQTYIFKRDYAAAECD